MLLNRLGNVSYYAEVLTFLVRGKISEDQFDDSLADAIISSSLITRAQTRNRTEFQIPRVHKRNACFSASFKAGLCCLTLLIDFRASVCLIAFDHRANCGQINQRETR